MVEINNMDAITTAMMEHVCDNLCRHPRATKDEEELEEICAGCEMGKYVCEILNLYNDDRQATEVKEGRNGKELTK